MRLDSSRMAELRGLKQENCPRYPSAISRREFLKSAGVAGVGALLESED